MNEFHDTSELPEPNRMVWLVKKDNHGHNDWWTIILSEEDKGMPPEQWFKDLCDRNKFFAWSYYPYGVSR